MTLTINGVPWDIIREINVAKSNASKASSAQKIVNTTIVSVGGIDYGLAPKPCQRPGIFNGEWSAFVIVVAEKALTKFMSKFIMMFRRRM